MLKLKLQYFGHKMGRTDSFEKTLMLGKIEGRRRRGHSYDLYNTKYIDNFSKYYLWDYSMVSYVFS